MRIGFGYVLFIIIIALGALPILDGFYFRDNYLKIIANLNNNSSSTISVTAYRMGWLTSLAELAITSPDGSNTINVEQRITHGPLIKDTKKNKWVLAEAQIESQVHVDRSIETILIGSSAETGVMQITTLVSFTNNYLSEARTPVFSATFPNGSKLSWQGVAAVASADFVSYKLNSFRSSAVTGPFVLQNPSATIQVQSITAQGEKTCRGGQLCSGTSNLSVPDLIEIMPDKNIKMSGFNMTATFAVDKQNVYNSKMQMTLAKLERPDYTVGPVNITVGINNINAIALQKIINITRDATATMNQQQSFGVTVGPSDSQRYSRAGKILLLAQYNVELPHLIMRNTEINEDIVVKTSDGDLTSSGKLFWPQSAPLPASSSELVNMNLQFNVHAPVKLIDQMIAAIDAKTRERSLTPILPNNKKPLKAKSDVSNTDTSTDTNTDNATKNSAERDASISVTAPAVPKAGFDANSDTQSDSLIGLHTDTSDTSNSLAGLSDDTSAPPANAAPESPIPEKMVMPPILLKPKFDNWVKQGYVTKENDNYVITIDYENGVMKINNLVIPLTRPEPALR